MASYKYWCSYAYPWNPYRHQATKTFSNLSATAIICIYLQVLLSSLIYLWYSNKAAIQEIFSNKNDFTKSLLTFLKWLY